jgi:hypothetical protein
MRVLYYFCILILREISMRPLGKLFRLTFILSWLILSAASSQLQATEINNMDQDLLGVKYEKNSFSLLDPARFRLQQSYSFSYFSNSKYSGSLGVYTTTLNYQLSQPLSLTVSLNYLHQPLSVFGRDNMGVKDDILPNFQLHYRPSNSFSLWINVITFPSAYDRGYANPWWER